MKFSLLLAFFSLLLPAVAALGDHYLLRHNDASLDAQNEKEEIEERSLVNLDHWRYEGCIEVKNGKTRNGNSFVLGDCTNYGNGVDIEFLEGGSESDDYSDDAVCLVRLRLDPTKCMQATHGSDNNVKRGAWMRVYPCDESNPLQRFHVWDNLRLENTNLCSAFLGGHPHYYEDHIFLRECNKVRYGWSED